MPFLALTKCHCGKASYASMPTPALFSRWVNKCDASIQQDHRVKTEVGWVFDEEGRGAYNERSVGLRVARKKEEK